MQTAVAAREPAPTFVPALKRISARGWIKSSPFLLIHGVALYALTTEITATAALLCASAFLIRKFGITAGYHRYFSHRSYKAGRVMQFVLAWLGCMSAQKGPLWWASHHRLHHQYSDGPNDVHSALRDGFFWSHVGWIISTEYDKTDMRVIPDFAKYPELRWMNRFHLVPPILLGVACFLIGGMPGLLWGFMVSTVILWHSTFFINSACHVFGKKRFPTKDESRNSLWLALLTLGEGWHNNHHYYPSSANQGFYWWEIDISYYVLKALSAVGLVSDLRRPPARILALGRALSKS